MEEIEFNKKYITPFYMDLMKLNFLRKPENESLFFLSSIEHLAKELENEQLVGLLNDHWRSSKVGAWMICLSDRVDLKPELVKYISTGSNHYSEHALLCLLIMAKQDAGNDIYKFVERQIRRLRTDDILNIERFSIDWGISILGYLDIEYNFEYVQTIWKEDWWLKFEIQLNEIRPNNPSRNMFKPEYLAQAINDLILLLQKR